MRFPELVVFDLDFTLWHCGGTYIDCTRPPFHKTGEAVIDRDGREIAFFPDVTEIVDKLREQGILLAIASRTQEPGWAREALDLLEARDWFEYEEIFPDSKVSHFRNLKEASEIEYTEMLFFDDEMRNIGEVNRLGVTSIFVRDGLNCDVFDEGLSRWRQFH